MEEEKSTSRNLERKQRETFLRYLSKKQAIKWDLKHKNLKKNFKTFGKLFIFGNLVLYGYTVLYWFEYDMNIFNPKLSKYITHRLG